MKKLMMVAMGSTMLMSGFAEGEKIQLIDDPRLPKETQAQKDARMKWWVDARFGMFIHFGLYATLGRHEWVQYYESIPSDKYAARYMQRFNPDLFDARKWVRAAKAAGMKYMVLTTKHHEGFSMFDTKLSDFKITNTPFKRDLIREYVDACREEGMRVGFYFSIIDWHHPDFLIDAQHPMRIKNPNGSYNKEANAKLNEKRDMAKYREFMFGQVKELLTNYGKIDILFFDFTHKGYKERNINDAEDFHSVELLALARKLQPEMVINDRLGLQDYIGGWDMKTPEQILVPKCVEFNGQEVYWEACQTFSGSWGYFRDEETWKSPNQLIYNLVDCVSKKGNLLLNVGPTARGEFDYRANDRLKALSEWMHFNARSIHGCTAAPEGFVAPEGTKLTYNPETKTLYMHLFQYPIKVLGLPFADKIAYAQFLHDGSEITIRQPRHVGGSIRKDMPASLNLPVRKPNVEVPVVELFLK